MNMLKPFIKWTGGKGRVLSQIIPKFEGLYDDMYVEPFLGGGAVLFRLQPKNAIVADINSNLIITYKMIKNSVDKLIPLLKKWKSEYPEHTEVQKDENGKRLKDKNNKNIHTPREEYFYKKRDRYNEIKFYENNIGNGETSDKNIEIAALFLFLNRTAFNGMYRENQSGNKRGRYNVPIGSYKNPNFVNENLLKIVSKYLNENNIEIYCDSYQNILQRVNKRFEKDKKILIYLDPPYYPADTSKFTTYTANKFAVEEQIELAKLFKQQKFPTFLSNSSCQEIRNLYENYVIHDIQVMRSISAKASSRGTITEVLIKNELINDGETEEEEEKEEIKIENNSTNSNTQNNSMSNKCKSKTKKNKPCTNKGKFDGYCGIHKRKSEKKVDEKVEDNSVKKQEEEQKPVETAEDDKKQMKKIEEYFEKHLDTKLDNIFEESLLQDWISNGSYFTKMIELSRKKQKKESPFANRCKILELKLAGYISGKYLDLEIKTQKQWTTLFGETLVKYCIEIIDSEKACHCKFIDKDKKTLKPDWETSKNIYEVKTRNYYTPGTAGEKILGTPIKYSDAKEITGKNVKIVIVAYQEWEAINEFHIFDTKSNNRTSILHFFEERLGITYVKFSNLFKKAAKIKNERIN